MHPIETIIQAGEPVEHRGVVIVPLYPRSSPRAGYVTLDEALPRGLTIAETGEAGSVPELLVDNPLGERVLLYDGEELAGAKQNRILNVTVLVDAKSRLTVPVSCVEQGRWRETSATFAAAPQTANPAVRRRKSASLLAAPLARGVAQSEVWDAVAETAGRLGVSSPTGANADTFRAHATSLDELERAFPAQPGQSGALLALGDTLCLDWLSRPEAFAVLWPKLRRGYLLDALDRLGGKPAGRAATGGFLTAIGAARVSTGPSAGLGEDVRLSGDRVVGSGLELDGELLQLSAFSTAGEQRPGRIARPSLRHH